MPDLRRGTGSFQELETERNRGSDAMKCATFLDENARYIAAFDDKGQSDHYHAQILEDISPSGAISKFFGAKYHRHFSNISKQYLQLNDRLNSRSTFVRIATEERPSMKTFWEQWAAVRYYTTPLMFDRIRVRDMPCSAAIILQRTGVLAGPYIEKSNILKEFPDPMYEVARHMALCIPDFETDKDIRVLGNAVLSARKAVPQAVGKFADIVKKNQALELSKTLNESLMEAYLSEPVFPNLSDTLRQKVKRSAKNALRETLIGVALSLLGSVSIPIDFIKNFSEPFVVENQQKKVAPWKVSAQYCIDLYQKTSADKRQ
ncbi:MAG: hypothetical protein LBC12_07765 [Nitrososphaerota archaeon]|nr:hypothetical protein [Nitrososphaerota archaeon]